MTRDDPEVSVEEAKSNLSHLIRQLSRGEFQVLVDQSGNPVAAIISVDDLQWLRRLEQRREALFERIDRMQEALKDVPPEEIEQDVDRVIARNRAADRLAKEELAAAR